MNTDVQPIGSPCTGICRVDEVSGYCFGCARTSAEIAEWSTAGNGRKREIWTELPRRFDQLGLAVTRLPWLPHEITAFIAGTLVARSGTWVTGCHGATAEFTIGADEAAEITLEPELTAVTARGALRFVPAANLRALEWRDPRAEGGVRAIFIVIPRPRNVSAPGVLLTACGPDSGAIQAAHRSEALYDLGLGRDHMRFAVRSAVPDVRSALNDAIGLPLDALFQRCGKTLLAHSPARIVETALGRIEVYTRIPAPGEASPNGPHTHLLPGQLALMRAAPAGIDLPDAYALCATFYPHNPPEDAACRPSGPDPLQA